MFEGNLSKMYSELNQTPSETVKYEMVLNDERVPLNSAIGKKITMKFSGVINCINCKKETKKSFGGGYCFPCTRKLAQCDICILKPELCHFADGTCREPEWGEKNCNIDHYVYLSNSSGVKVGITRHTQTPTRWIDQGAIAALPILKVSTRYQSGMFEKLIREVVSDKTNWRKMLKNDVEFIDLADKRDEIFEICEAGLEELEEEFGEDQIELLEEEEVVEINYPVLEYPEKVSSLNFDKTPTVEGILKGIKGQYLILDIGVINIRRHTGYFISLEF